MPFIIYHAQFAGRLNDFKLFTKSNSHAGVYSTLSAIFCTWLYWPHEFSVTEVVQWKKGAHLTKYYSITNQLGWKFPFGLFAIPEKWSLQNYMLSWHVPNLSVTRMMEWRNRANFIQDVSLTIEVRCNIDDCKTAVSTLLTHWRYCSLTVRHQYNYVLFYFSAKLWQNMCPWHVQIMIAIIPCKKITVRYIFRQMRITSKKNDNETSPRSV